MTLRVLPRGVTYAAAIADTRNILQNKGLTDSLAEGSTTLGGAPAYDFWIAGKKFLNYMVLQANGPVYLVYVQYSLSTDPQVDDLENRIMDKILSSTVISTTSAP